MTAEGQIKAYFTVCRELFTIFLHNFGLSLRMPQPMKEELLRETSSVPRLKVFLSDGFETFIVGFHHLVR